MLDAIFKSILTGQMKSFPLLLIAVAIFIYFLPSMLAFLKGHRRFAVILVLNILVSPLQSAALQLLFPGFLMVTPGLDAHTLLVMMIANLGPAWLALLIWALQSGEPDPRLVRAQDTKLYDVIAALPLILWFAYGAWQIRPYIINDIVLI